MSDRINGRSRITITGINYQAETRESLRLEPDLFKERWNQIIRHIVNRAESDVFQRLRCGALPRTGEPREQHDLMRNCRRHH
jgi:hypothetical protein